jgi:hypothetical protein
VASKAGFLSRRIWDEHLNHGQRSWRFRQWKRLVSNGYFSPCKDFGFTRQALVLSGKGIDTAMALGMDPVGPPGAQCIWHDDDLISMALPLEYRGLITQWNTESELKIRRMKELFRFQEESRNAKFPDLLLKLAHPNATVLWAVELERTRKDYTRYLDLVQAYAGISTISAVLIVVATRSIEANIQQAMQRLSYPQTKRPMIFADYNDFLARPDLAALRMGERRSTIAAAVARWQTQGSRDQCQTTLAGGNIEGNIGGNNVSDRTTTILRHKTDITV